MTKSLLAIFAVLFALSTPSFASSFIYQEEPAAGEQEKEKSSDYAPTVINQQEETGSSSGQPSGEQEKLGD